MTNFDFSDFYIRYKGHPTFNSNEIIEDETIRVIVMKYEMILFTNKGEVYGEPLFGADLERLLHETKVSADFVKRQIVEQIVSYIPEIANLNYFLNVEFQQDPERYQDMMFVDFKISDVEVNAYFA